MYKEVILINTPNDSFIIKPAGQATMHANYSHSDCKI